MTTPFPFTQGQVLTAAQLNAITELVVNDKTASYTLVAGDAGERVIMNSASATTITVNTSIFTAGQLIYITNKGAGVCTITAGTATVSTTGTLALKQFASGVLYCISAGVFLFEAYGVASTSGVVQVKSTTKSDTFSFTTNGFVDVTGLSVSITPTSATNKIFVVSSISIGSSVTSSALFQLMRDSTAIGIGDAASSRTRTTGSTFSADGNVVYSVGATFLDSPATTSATTYKVQIRNAAAANTSFVNRSVTDTDTSGTIRSISTITVFEVTP